MKVEDVMTREVVTMGEHDSLRDAITAVQRNRIRQIPIVEGRHLLGMVSDRDIKRATPSLHGGISQEEFDRTLDELKLSQVMTRDPLSVRRDTSIKEAVGVMIDRKYGALPVVEDNELIGIVTSTDMLRVLHSML